MNQKKFPLIRQRTQCPLFGWPGAVWCQGVKRVGALTCSDCKSARDQPDVMQMIRDRETELRHST